jgi:hypothetical protein
MRAPVIAVLVAAVAVSFAASSAEIRQLEVDKRGKRIHIDSQMFLAAPRHAVFAALADYDRFSEFSSRYLESGFIPPDFDGTPRIYTKVQGCVLFFCRTIKRYSRLELTPDELIVALVDAQLSDLKFGHERWELADATGGTLVVYRHELEPDFWVPPLIGVWAIRRILASDALKAATRIERMAQDKQ